MKQYLIRLTKSKRCLAVGYGFNFTYKPEEMVVFNSKSAAEKTVDKFGIHYLYDYEVVPVEEVIKNDKRPIHSSH